MGERPGHLHPPFAFPKGYCREGHPIQAHTALGSVGDLTRIHIPPEASEMLQRQSLEIFTLMSNAGSTFAACLASVLLTGIHWGANAVPDQPTPSQEGGAG